MACTLLPSTLPSLPAPAQTGSLIIVIKSSSLYAANICDVRRQLWPILLYIKANPGQWENAEGEGGGVREVYKYNFVNVRYGNEKGCQLFWQRERAARWAKWTMSSGGVWVEKEVRM